MPQAPDGFGVGCSSSPARAAPAGPFFAKCLFPSKLARKYEEDNQRVLRTGLVLDTVEAHKPPGKGTIYVRVVKSPVLDSDLRVMGLQGIFWEVPASK
jgi:hypothetical protein